MYKIAKTHMDMGHGLVGHAQEHGDHKSCWGLTLNRDRLQVRSKIPYFAGSHSMIVKQCVSERVPSWSSRCCSSRPTGCCGVAILWICAPIDLPKPRRQPFCVQVRHLSLSSSCSCRQDKSLDFLWCGQEEGEVARNRAS